MEHIQKAKNIFKELLLKTEPYTKTNMLYVAKQGFWSVLGQIIGSGASAVAVILLANLLSKESFGQYRFILSFIPILLIAALPGISSAFSRTVAREEKIDLPRIIRTQITWGSLGSLVAVIISLFYLHRGDNILFSAMMLVAVFLPFIQPFTAFSSYYKGKQDFKTATLYGSVVNVAQAILLVVAALIFKNTLAVLIGFLIGQVIVPLFFHFKMLSKEKSLSAESAEAEDHSDETIKYGKLLTATQIIGTITGNIDKILTGYLFGAEILAIYSVALTIPSNVVLILNVVPRIAFPKFARNTWQPSEKAKIIYKLFVFFVALIIPTLIYFLLAPIITPLIFRNYEAALPAALVFGALVLISPLNAMIDSIFQARKLIKGMIASQCITLITFIAVFLFIYVNFGPSAIGTAVALIASEVAQFIFGIFFVRR